MEHVVNVKNIHVVIQIRKAVSPTNVITDKSCSRMELAKIVTLILESKELMEKNVHQMNAALYRNLIPMEHVPPAKNIRDKIQKTIRNAILNNA